MSSSKAVRLIATIMFLSTGFVLFPHGSANATAPKYCGQVRGAAAASPDCSFDSLKACRAGMKGKGGGHCYKMH
jgi:hypothetical protein